MPLRPAVERRRPSCGLLPAPFCSVASSGVVVIRIVAPGGGLEWKCVVLWRLHQEGEANATFPDSTAIWGAILLSFAWVFLGTIGFPWISSWHCHLAQGLGFNLDGRKEQLKEGNHSQLWFKDASQYAPSTAACWTAEGHVVK